jgi:periplasmic protein CpxP/Spy
MKVFRIGAVAALLAVTAGAAEAQRGEGHKRGDHHEKGGQVLGRMADSLDLTEAQRTQIRTIHEHYRPQFEHMNATARTHMQQARDARQRGDTAAARSHREQARASMEANRAQNQQLRTAMQSEVRAVLTPDQQAKFDQLRTQLREHAHPRGPGARPFRGGERGQRTT